MKNSKLILISIVLSVLFIFTFNLANCNTLSSSNSRSIVCFWNNSLLIGKLKNNDIREAADLCTHLIYGFADIDPTNFKAKILNDLSEKIDDWKEEFPQLRIYLSVGKNPDDVENSKYLTLLETAENRNLFINSVIDLVKKNNFDGVDLAWPFPPTAPPKKPGLIKKVWNKIKSAFNSNKFTDDKVDQHRNQFTSLVRDLKNQLRIMNKNLTLTVPPHMNFTAYYEIRLLAPNIEAVHLMCFDQKTADRTPYEANYPAPIYDTNDSDDHENNINAIVSNWMNKGMPKSKIIVGIPTYARTWNVPELGAAVPPLISDGPGTPNGFLSYSEVCTLLKEPSIGKFSGAYNKYGKYAFKVQNGKQGIWIGYEDPDIAKSKATYVKAKDLGGIAISDLSTDDVFGSCSEDKDKFPILRAIKSNL